MLAYRPWRARQGLLALMVGCLGVQVVDDRRFDVLLRLVALVCREAVGQQVVAVPHLDGLLALPVRAKAGLKSVSDEMP